MQLQGLDPILRVLGFGNRLYFLKIFAKANFASDKANLIPIQPLVPCPKGKNAYQASINFLFLKK